MLFNSVPFLIFLAAVLVAYWALLGSWSARKTLLLGASWLFYASWSPRFLAVLVATTGIDFLLARWVYARRWQAPGVEYDGGRRRAQPLLIASLAVNLGLLAFFKYGGFLYRSAAAVAALPPTPGFLDLAVPLGISFYTFHSISYVIDTYRGLRPPTTNFRDFALYVSFFPQLVAGPITRWGFFGPQLDQPPQVRSRAIEGALFLIALGFVKKVVCADSLGSFVDEVYRDPGGVGRPEMWLALYAYAFQIYFDFSGYTDIALGVAGLLGLRLPENFRHPYVAENPAEFWHRWHISLSTWLRDYLYISLGGNRRGTARTYANLMITMVLGGLWHGAAWTFVLWGAVHGVWLVLHRALVTVRPTPVTPRWLRRLVTFHLVCAAWVLFRAGDLATAAGIFQGLVAARPVLGPFPVGALLVVAIGAVAHFVSLRVELPRLWSGVPRPVQGVGYAVVIVLVGLFSAQSGRFIYFQF
jgi:alginate O-acetyltransferase complex protein AlgI